MERAAFIAAKVDILKRRAGIDPAKDGRVASADARWKKAVANEAKDASATIAVAYGWADDVAEQIGLSRRTVEYDLMLYRRLAPSLIARLREVRHPAAGNASQLRALAKLDEADQGRAVAMLLDGRAKGVGDAVKALSGKRAPDPADKRFSAIIGTLSRMGHAERTGLLQSPDFHALLPAEARVLLAPMLRSAEA